jgi:hypothetical protein
MNSRWSILLVVAALVSLNQAAPAAAAKRARQPVRAETPAEEPLPAEADAAVPGERAAQGSPNDSADEERAPDDEQRTRSRRRRMYDDEEVPEKPKPIPSLDNLLPDIDETVPPPASAMPEAPPERWLDTNYQFLKEDDPFLPGTDPFREWPDVCVGWFAGIELTAARPRIHSEISSGTLGPGDFVSGTFANTFQLPVANLEWFAMPKVYVGYRRPNGLGEYLLSYRFIQSDGQGMIANFDAAGAGQLSTMLRAHVIDLEYGWTDDAWELPWYLPHMVRRSFGLRAASAVFDSSASGAQILNEREGNVFIGAGPRVNFEATWATAVPSLAFVGGADVSGVVGFNYQRFGETAIVGGSVLNASGRTDGTTTATPILRVQGALSWVPDWRDRTLRFSAGYQWERWWILTDTNSQVEITLQGPFVRGEVRW